MTTNPIITLLACGCVSLQSVSMAEPLCHSNAKYHVVEQAFDDDAGNRFAVTRLDGRPAPSQCSFDQAKADHVIGKPGDALWFGEIAGNALVLTRSTGPQGDVVVYDLDSGKPILDVPADDYAVKSGKLTFWERTSEATADNCPDFAENQANGLGSVTAVEKVFDLADHALTETGASKCVATQ